MAKEKNFENKIKKYLKEKGFYFIKYWGGGEFTKAGVPDILACINGFFFGIEVKSETGKPSPLQLINLKQIDDAGGFGILLYPDDFEEFKEFVEIIEKGDSISYYYQSLKERWIHRWEQLQK